MENNFILVLGLGGSQHIAMARKLRVQGYYTEILSGDFDPEALRRKSPRGILIVGGDHCEDASSFPAEVLTLGVPVLAMGGASYMLALSVGCEFEGILLEKSASQINFLPCPLFDQLSESDRYFVRVDGFKLAEGFEPIATTIDGLTPAFADFSRKLYGLQFYAESNDPDGSIILSNFAEKICGCAPTWSIESYVDEECRFIRERIGDGEALIAVSGGIDSTACALLLKRAIGDRLRCVFIDNGLLREGEGEFTRQLYADLGLNLLYVDARERFLERLNGVTDPVRKHEVIHNEFFTLLSEVSSRYSRADTLVQGTIYSDLLTPSGQNGPYARKFRPNKLVEPLRMLFKDEVRELSAYLGVPQAVINRQAFPSPALAIRCCGNVTAEKLSLLRRADTIVRQCFIESGQEKKLSRFFAVLTDTRSVSRRDGSEKLEYVCALRAVAEQDPCAFTVARLPFDLLERISQRIAEEIPGIGRVVYDLSGSTYANIEWE